MIKKINEGRPNIIDLLINGKVDLVINTPSGRKSKGDGYEIRRTAIRNNIPYVTTIPAALATVIGMKSIRENDTRVLNKLLKGKLFKIFIVTKKQSRGSSAW